MPRLTAPLRRFVAALLVTAALGALVLLAGGWYFADQIRADGLRAAPAPPGSAGTSTTRSPRPPASRPRT